MFSYSTSPEILLEFIREVIEDGRYRNKNKRLRRLARELDGLRAVREMLEKKFNRNNL